MRFAFRRYFAYQNIARLDGCADADDARFIQITEERFGNIWNIASDFLRPQLGIATLDLELFNMDRGVVVILDQLFADHDGVFEVVPAPWHKRHQHVASQRQFSVFRTRSVRENVAFLYPLALENDWLLIDTGVLIGALEFGELINVRADFARHLAFLNVAFHTHNHAFRID